MQQIQPPAVRIFHWVMAGTVVLLVLTGLFFYTQPETIRIPTRLIRLVHGSGGFVLMANLTGQIYFYAITGKYKEVLFGWWDLGNVPGFLRYAFFLTANHPNFGKYNPGQKLIYTSWALAVMISAVSGLVLMFPGETILFQRWFGGLQTFRLIKYFITSWFVITIPVHLYLVFTEDPAKLQAMLTGYVKKEKTEKR